jgi:hypothetical protein
LTVSLLLGVGLFGAQTGRHAEADDSIGGSWAGALTTSATTVTGAVTFAAHAAPVGRGTATVDHVNFTALVNGSWIVACAVSPPTSGDLYQCNWTPGIGPWTARTVTVSFDVYSAAGGVRLAPNGEHTVHFNGGHFLNLPFDASNTWYVCQGYNGPVDHTTKLYAETALDLSVDPASPTTGGCDPATAGASTGQAVYAPADGSVSNYFSQSDMVCITFDAGGSAVLGHLSNRPLIGARVKARDLVGYLNPPQPYTDQGGYAHIQIRAFAQPGCPIAKPPVPFDSAHNAAFIGLVDLPFDPAPSDINQYSGLALVAGP